MIYSTFYVAGMEAAHIATLIGDRGTVFAFGALPAQMNQLDQKILSLGLNSILSAAARLTSPKGYIYVYYILWMAPLLPGLQDIIHPLQPIVTHISTFQLHKLWATYQHTSYC